MVKNDSNYVKKSIKFFNVELIEKKKWTAYCNGCGCPIDKKIFSGKVNPCPLEKWDEIDKKYNTYIGMKHKKTLL
jgi:hypothetical protein